MTKFTRFYCTIFALVLSGSCFLNVTNARAQSKEAAADSSVASAPFQLASPTPHTLTLVQGQAGMATLALASGKSFRGEVQLRCTGATPGIQCLVSPQSVRLTPGETSEATVAVATQGSSTYNLKSSVGGGWIGGLAGNTPAIAGLCYILYFRRKFARLPILCAMSLAALVLISGCAGSKAEKPPVTPIGNTMLKITASSGAITQSQDLSVTVEQP